MDNSLRRKKVLVTCERELAQEFSKKLENSGAEVFVLPAIEIKPVAGWDAVDKYISALETYDWLIFTSQHAVRYFFQRMEQLTIRNDRQNKPKIAAVGESTKNRIEENNYDVSFTPEKFTALDLAQTLPGIAGKKILFPHGDKISRAAIDELKKRGACVDEVIVYTNETVILNEAAMGLLSEKFDFIIFMSPSAVKNIRNFISKSNIVLNHSPIMAIGPETGNAARNEFENVTVADVHTMDGIIKKILEYDLSTAKITR